MDALRRWLSTHAPHLLAALADPIDPESLEATERLLSRPLPADYVAFLRRNDGQRVLTVRAPDDVTLAPLFEAFTILGSSHARQEWHAMQAWSAGERAVEAVGPVQPRYAHSAWWPITLVHGSRHHHCLDLDPAPGGGVGQVIVVARDDDRRVVIAPSFGAFVDRLTTHLERSSPVAIGEGGIELGDDALDWVLGS